MPLDAKRDRHLMYPIVCDCVHSSDKEDEDKIYEILPPLNVEYMHWFINKPRKWTDRVHNTNNIDEFNKLVGYIDHFDLPLHDKRKVNFCLSQDVHGTWYHGFNPLLNININKCTIQ